MLILSYLQVHVLLLQFTDLLWCLFVFFYLLLINIIQYNHKISCTYFKLQYTRTLSTIKVLSVLCDWTIFMLVFFVFFLCMCLRLMFIIWWTECVRVRVCPLQPEVRSESFCSGADNTLLHRSEKDVIVRPVCSATTSAPQRASFLSHIFQKRTKTPRLLVLPEGDQITVWPSTPASWHWPLAWFYERNEEEITRFDYFEWL